MKKQTKPKKNIEQRDFKIKKNTQHASLDEMELFLKKIILKAGNATLKLYEKTSVAYTKKNMADVVTHADLLSNKIITDAIKKKYPSHGIISEETPDENNSAEYIWIIDPLDGTRNYSTNTPFFGVLIALTKNGKVILAGNYLPYFKELYTAKIGNGAYLNGKRIYCSKTKEFGYSYGMTTASISGGRINSVNALQKLLNKTAKTPIWLNHFGCIASNSALVATGKRDWLFAPGRGGVWDTAAPSLILKEAGCIVTNFKGEEYDIKDEDFIAANPSLHKELLNILK